MEPPCPPLTSKNGCFSPTFIPSVTETGVCWLKLSFSAIFWAKKLQKRKKSNKFVAKFSKKMCFLSFHQNTGWKFYSPQKNFWPALWCKLKNPFFPKIWNKFVTFLHFCSFLHKKCWKWQFQPVFGVPSTQTLVEIYNKRVPPTYLLTWSRLLLLTYRKKELRKVLTNEKGWFVL